MACGAAAHRRQRPPRIIVRSILQTTRDCNRMAQRARRGCGIWGGSMRHAHTWTPAPRADQQASSLCNRGGSSCRASCHTQAVPARRFPSQRGARYATIIALLALSHASPRMCRWYGVSCSTMSALLRRDLGEGRGRVGALPGDTHPNPRADRRPRHTYAVGTVGCPVLLGRMDTGLRRHRCAQRAPVARTTKQRRAGVHDTSQPPAMSVSTDTASPHSNKGYP